jgi:Tol biopolymer transport system component
MIKYRVAACYIIILIALYGCSVNTLPSAGPTAAPTVQPQSIDTPASGKNGITIPLPGTNIPITWGNLNITGKLVYTAAVIQNNQLLVNVNILDLTTGAVKMIFQTPYGAWLDALTVSPDNTQMVLSYAPPVDAPFYGGIDTLYIMPLDGSQTPQLLLTPPPSKEGYFEPEWSPDGKYVYFAHFDFASPTNYELMRVAYPNGEAEQLADKAFWPRISNDGSSLVFTSTVTGVNTLFVSNADGSGAHQVKLTGPYIPTVIDAPMFAADDQSILFSAPALGLSFTPSWLDRLLGVTEASADGTIVSDWWSVPLAGGTPKRLTHIQSLNLFARFSPDRKHIASYCADGIFIMNPDGSGVTQVIQYTGGQPGTVNWIP